jgi:fatty-acid desaturase
VVSFHLGALAALFYFRWSALVAFAVVWILAQNVGIAIGYHRLLTHRGYATPNWLEYCIAVCGTLALQGGPIYWVAVHRMHHRYTDKAGNSHSPRDGKWWSHMGWIMNGSLRNEPKRSSDMPLISMENAFMSGPSSASEPTSLHQQDPYRTSS